MAAGGWLVLRQLVSITLLACCVRAEPSLQCPDYVAKHAPLVWLHSADPFQPSDILTHIQHTTPQLDGKPISNLPKLDLDNLELLNEYGDQVALTANEDPFSYPEWLFGETPDATGKTQNATSCVVILVERSETEVDAFYFYFYSYDQGPNITQAMEPFNRLITSEKIEAGMHFGNHVGDWEHNMIRFRSGIPVGIFYSQHRDGMAYSWEDPMVSKSDGRPIVYSARGSHANYPAAGDQRHDVAMVDWCDAGRKWDPILSSYFYSLDPSTFAVARLIPPNNQSSPPPPSSNLTSFLYFTGRWGDIQYPDSDPRQETVPYFGVRRLITGPNGPRFKHLVRKGLMPDEKRKLGWVEWAVTIYMAWYPCCLKGWRLWVSLLLVFGVSTGAVFGIILGVRKYRLRASAYKRLGEDEILLDDWRMEGEALLSSSDEGGDGHPD